MTIEEAFAWFDGPGDAFFLDLTRTQVWVQSEKRRYGGLDVEFRIQYHGPAERVAALSEAIARCAKVLGGPR